MKQLTARTKPKSGHLFNTRTGQYFEPPAHTMNAYIKGERTFLINADHFKNKIFNHAPAKHI